MTTNIFHCVGGEAHTGGLCALLQRALATTHGRRAARERRLPFSFSSVASRRPWRRLGSLAPRTSIASLTGSESRLVVSHGPCALSSCARALGRRARASWPRATLLRVYT